MSNKRTITEAQRFGIWKAGGGRCFWCEEPVLFKACHVDHVIPLQAVQDEAKKQSIRALYALSENFDFDSYGNWVSAHAHCNQKKSFLLPNPSPIFSVYLEKVGRKTLLAMKTAETIEADKSTSKILARLGTAISKGDVTEEEIREFLSNLPVIVQKSAPMGFLQQEELLISPGWKVIEVRGFVLDVLPVD